MIYTRVPVIDAIKTFDLSICATWCEFSKNMSSTLYTLDRTNTLHKIMYHLREELTEYEQRRIAKYQSRGYVLLSDITEKKVDAESINTVEQKVDAESINTL